MAASLMEMPMGNDLLPGAEVSVGEIFRCCTRFGSALLVLRTACVLLKISAPAMLQLLLVIAGLKLRVNKYSMSTVYTLVLDNNYLLPFRTAENTNQLRQPTMTPFSVLSILLLLPLLAAAQF